MKRINLLQALAAAPVEVAQTVAETDEIALRLRPAPDEWSAADVINHLIDVEGKFRARLVRIVEEERPFLPYFGPDESKHDPIARKEELLSLFAEVRADTLAYLKTLKPLDWRRPAVHATFGPTNLRFHVQNMMKHDREHMHQLIALREWRLEIEHSV